MGRYVIASCLVLLWTGGALQADELFLKITTKLGAEAEADVASVTTPKAPLFWFGGHGLAASLSGDGSFPLAESKLALRLAEDMYLLFPWVVIQSVDVQDKLQVVTLKNGQKYLGTVVTEVRTREGKTYTLSAAASIAVTKATPPKAKEKSPTVKGILHVKQPTKLDMELASLYSYPTRPQDIGITFSAGESFQVRVDGEVLQGNWFDFEKVTLSGKGVQWELTIKARNGKVSVGEFIPPRNDTIRSTTWIMSGHTVDGCVVLFRGGFELESVRATAK
jgi:hypothetical protein